MRIIGVFAIIFGVVGLSYNWFTIDLDYSKQIQELGASSFYPIFYLMSGICVTFYAVLILCGVQLLRTKIMYLKVFLLLNAVEVIYYFGMMGFWRVKNSFWPVHSIGDASVFEKSAAGAMGVANGGLMFQFITLFPLWGFLIAWWCLKQTRSYPKAPDAPTL